MESHQPPVHKNYFVKAIEYLIFNLRWLLVPFYLGLSFILGMYFYTYVFEILETYHHVHGKTPQTFLLILLEFADIVMVANLIIMVVTGSYNSFVSKRHGYENVNISSGMLKIKMSTSVILISTIHLLQTFLDADTSSWESIKKQLAIHGIFLIGALVLSVGEYLHIKSEGIEHDIEKSKHSK